MNPRILFLVALSTAFLPLTAVAAGDPAAGKVKAYTCTGCHGIPGYKNTYPTYNVPKLGGQSFEYLVAAFGAYQAGERDHGTMNLQAESLSREDIADIAAYLSALEPVESEHDEGPASGREKSTPCQACHGENGIGIAPMYPNLGGQYASYLAKALTDYRDGRRVDPLMVPMAVNLTDQDIEDLAAWYASLGGLQVLPEGN